MNNFPHIILHGPHYAPVNVTLTNDARAAIKVMLRILGRKGSTDTWRDIREQLFGAFTMANWLVADFPDTEMREIMDTIYALTLRND